MSTDNTVVLQTAKRMGDHVQAPALAPTHLRCDLRAAAAIAAVILAFPHGANAGDRLANDRLDTTAVLIAPRTSSVECTDVRTGLPFAFQARRVLPWGSVDSGWQPDSSICRGTVEGFRPVSVGDGAGGIFVGGTTTSGDEPDILLDRITPAGVRANGWPMGGIAIAAFPHSQYHAALAADGTGGVYVAWEDYREGQAGEIYAQRVGSDGAVSVGWSQGGNAVCRVAGEQSVPRVSVGNDGPWIAWQDRRSGVLELYVQKLTSIGSPTPGWPEGGVRVSSAAPPAIAPMLATDSTGSTLVVWRHARADGLEDLLATPITNLSPQGGTATPLVLAGGASRLGDVTAIPFGSSGLLVSWAQEQGGIRSVRAQRVSPSGSGEVQWTEGGLAVATAPVTLNGPIVISDGAGGAWIGWEDYRAGDHTDIYVQRISAEGAVASGWPTNGLGVGTGPGDQNAPQVARDGQGAVIVT